MIYEINSHLPGAGEITPFFFLSVSLLYVMLCIFIWQNNGNSNIQYLRCLISNKQKMQLKYALMKIIKKTAHFTHFVCHILLLIRCKNRQRKKATLGHQFFYTDNMKQPVQTRLQQKNNFERGDGSYMAGKIFECNVSLIIYYTERTVNERIKKKSFSIVCNAYVNECFAYDIQFDSIGNFII